MTHPNNLSILITLVLTWSGLLFWAVRWLLKQYQVYLDQRFAALEESFGEESGKLRNLERELLELKIQLPTAYVRREDQIRQDTVINAKLDALWKKIDKIQTGGANER